MTGDEFGELIRDITKRIIIAGIAVIIFGLLVILLMYIFYGGM